MHMLKVVSEVVHHKAKSLQDKLYVCDSGHALFKRWNFLPLGVSRTCLLKIMLCFQSEMGVGRNLRLKDLSGSSVASGSSSSDWECYCLFRALWRPIETAKCLSAQCLAPAKHWLPIAAKIWGLIFPDLPCLLPTIIGYYLVVHHQCLIMKPVHILYQVYTL